jgi:hypothetical protein
MHRSTCTGRSPRRARIISGTPTARASPPAPPAARAATLSSAPPAAFGFLPRPHGEISYAGNNVAQVSQLAVPAGRSLTLAGGDVTITGATLRAEGGRVALLSAGRSGELPVASAPGIPSSGGAVTITGGGLVDVSGDTGGRVVVRGGTLGMDASQINADTVDGPGGGVVMALAGAMLLVDGSTISAGTSGSGRASDVIVRAGSVTLDAAGIRLKSSSAAVGAAGSLNLVTSGFVLLDHFAFLDSSSAGLARSGDLSVRAASVSIHNGSSIDSDTSSESTGLAGPAGDVRIVAAGKLALDGGAIILADSFGLGAGGNVSVRAGSISLTNLAGISTNSSPELTDLGAGPAGKLLIVATGSLRLDQSLITADTSGPARGGDVTVRAGGALTLTTGSTIGTRALDAESGAGDAGNLSVDAGGRLSLSGNSFLAATTLGPGAGGSVTVRAGGVSIRGTGVAPPSGSFFTGIAARSSPGDAFTPPATGAAGSVAVDSRSSIDIFAFGLISTDSAQGGNTLRLSAGQSVRLADHATVSARAQGNGAALHIRAPLLITLTRQSTITTQSGGNGGNITIDPLVLLLATGSTINANGGANGGNISLSATATPGAVFAGPNANVTATGATGTAGAIGTNPATTDVTNALARLPVDLFQPEYQLQPQCGVGGAFSSFLLTGNGGLPFDPATWQPPAADLHPVGAPTTREEP